MQIKKTTLGWLAVTLGTAAVAFGAGAAVAAKAAKTPELKLLKEATWTPLMKEGPLPASSPIQGDSSKGAHESYLKLPAGFESPPHSHGADYYAVLVQGKMTHWVAATGSEKDAKQLGVGDLTYMPAKVEHVSKCYPGAECIMVVVQKGKFDFIPAKAPPVAKAAPAAAVPAAAPVAAKGAPAPAAPPPIAPAPTAAAAPAPAPAAKTPASAPAPAPGAPAAPMKK